MTATLSALGIVGGIVGTVWARRGDPTPDDPTPPAPPTGAPQTFPMPLPALVNSPNTVDGQLELAKLLNEQSQRERAGLQARLEKTERRLDEAETEVETLKQRVAELAGINAQLRFVLESRGLQPPPLGPWAG